MENETPKHRKKRQKQTPKKSDHRHDYQTIGVIDNWIYRNNVKHIEYCRNHYTVTVTVKQECSICGKENRETMWNLSQERLEELVQQKGLITDDIW